MQKTEHGIDYPAYMEQQLGSTYVEVSVRTSLERGYVLVSRGVDTVPYQQMRKWFLDSGCINA